MPEPEATPNSPAADPVPDPAVGSSPPAEGAPSPDSSGVVPTDDGGAQPAPAGDGAPAPDDGDGGSAGVEPSWPANWRDIMAGGDAKRLAKLSRYASPVNVGNALWAANAKIGSGELVKAKPDGTDEDAMNEWRGSIGVPESPDGYLEKLPGGIVIGEADKPYVDTFAASMHAADMPPEAVHKALEWWHQTNEQMAAAQTEADATNKEATEEDLRAEYGPEYKGNINAVRNMIDLNGADGLHDLLMTARMADGSMLGAHPGAVKFLVNTALALNPTSINPPAVGQTPMKTAEDELAALNAEMADNNSDYYKNPAKQARWRELDTYIQNVKAA